MDFRLGDIMRGERATLGKSLLDVQRDLRIKATYIAAIENADPTAFSTPGFIAGYVRSYSRYLNIDPEWAWAAFRRESGLATFDPSPAVALATSSRNRKAEPGGFLTGGVSLGRMAQRQSGSWSIEPGAILSSVVLVGLIGLLGYGGLTVFKEVQKVRFVAAQEAPEVLAEIDPLDDARRGDGSAAGASGAAGGDGQPSDLFDRLYRPQALDVPVLVSRDAPIATLDPREVGTLLPEPAGDPRIASGAAPVPEQRGPILDEDRVAVSSEGAEAEPAEGAVQVVEDVIPEVEMFAVRPSWVRVRSAEGTVLLEKIMDAGDRFLLPRTEEPATLRTGESGAVYFEISDRTYGPVGRSGSVTSDLALDPESLLEQYSVADPDGDRDLARVVAELRTETGPVAVAVDPVAD